jgi:hypothetical protein
VTKDVFHIEKTFNTSLIKKENNLCQIKVIVEGPKTSPPFRGDEPNSQHPLFDIWGFKKHDTCHRSNSSKKTLEP